ncbi:hypothetical protein [Actinomadura sp. 9N407]|uniref:hypothetical protein n=1 Tax=Actinomadura sp. 9N407 TaxID=3375154 RepID=UPI0037B7A9E0
MEETFVLQESFGHSGRVELRFVPGGLQYEDALFSHRHGRTGDRDSLLKSALPPAGIKVLRREAEAYDRFGGRHTAFGRLLGFETARDPVCLLVTRRGAPISRCEAGLRLDAAQLTRAARDLFGALAALADLGFAHRAVSADSVFWDGLNIELQELGHVEPLGTGAALSGSALGSPTGLPVSDVSDVHAAARLLHRLATGRTGGGEPAAMVEELAQIDPGLAGALEPALHARPGEHPAPEGVVNRLWQSRPKSEPHAATSQASASQRSTTTQDGPVPVGSPAARTAAPPGAARDERQAQDHAHRSEFRELRRQQREFRQASRSALRPAAGSGTPAWTPGRSAPQQQSPNGGCSWPSLLAGALVVLIIVVVVLVVR